MFKFSKKESFPTTTFIVASLFSLIVIGFLALFLQITYFIPHAMTNSQTALQDQNLNSINSNPSSSDPFITVAPENK